MSVISRERIAELRRQALDLTDAHERAEALALLDAYDAQRTRTASEVPVPGVEVLLKLRGQAERRVGYHDGSGPGGPGHAWASEGDWHRDDEIECWWPLPPLPKGGEE